MSTTKNGLIISCSLIIANGASAANIPDAGVLIQEVAPQSISQPSSKQPKIANSSSAQKLKDETPFAIESIELIGNETFSQDELEYTFQDVVGKTATLSKLQRVCDLIGQYYHDHGYPLVRALVPKQTLNGGVVKIQIIEPKLESTTSNNPSQSNVRLVDDTLLGIPIGQVINDKDLERTLLLLSDLPGTDIEASLKPGEKAGTTSLQVNVNKAPKVRSLAKLSNHGGESLNRERFTGILQVQNPLNIGDQLDLSIITSGELLNFGAIQYGAIINGQGTRISSGVSHLNYKLGNQLKSLDANGDATSANIAISHPFIRSYNDNVTGRLTFNYNQFNDQVDSTNTENDRDTKTVSVSLSGHHKGALTTKGKNYWSTTLVNGKLDINNAGALTQDALTSNAQGSFSALKLSFNHVEPINIDSSLTFSFNAQQASGNLDSSQKIVLGGPNSIRAYDSSALSGDTGYKASVSFKHIVARGSYGAIQGEIFADAGRVKLNKKPWGNSTSKNELSIQGAGVGVNWYAPDQWKINFLVASDIGNKPAELKGVDSNRVWLEVSKEFSH